MRAVSASAASLMSTGSQGPGGKPGRFGQVFHEQTRLLEINDEQPPCPVIPARDQPLAYGVRV
jgi:hypothetical protein